jgi:hypothetical protein
MHGAILKNYFKLGTAMLCIIPTPIIFSLLYHCFIMNIGGENSKIAIEMINPDYIVIGSDWAKKDYYKQMGFDQFWLDEKGIGLVYVPYTKAISSTEIKKRLNG